MSPVRVDFYLLSNDQAQSRWEVACRLIEKVYLKGHKLYIHCANQQDAQWLDELLWTFKADSFIPHNLQGEGPQPPPPVQIGYEKEPRGFNDVLLNMTNQVLPFYPKFQRVMELVPNNDREKEESRTRYKEYRRRGCELFTHELELKQPAPTEEIYSP